MLMNHYIIHLNNILNNALVCKSHGIDHALAVLAHANEALNNFDYNIASEEILAVQLASLLHDVDDTKFFPNNKNYDNLRNIIQDQSTDIVNLTIRMVELVSSSKNADNIPIDIIEKEWMLIPRFSDRLEAIGLIGVERCFQYNKTKRHSLYLDITPRVKTKDDIWQIATKERYNSYVGKSTSMMCHYYDKLLRLGLFETVNPYLLEKCRERNVTTIYFVLYFSSLPNMTDEDVENWITNAKNQGYM